MHPRVAAVVRSAAVVVAFGAGIACTSLVMDRPSAPTTSSAVVTACPLGVPGTRIRVVDTAGGVDLLFATTPSGVDELRQRVRDQANVNGPGGQEGSGHGGRHRVHHNHGLQLWKAGPLDTAVFDTPSGARLALQPTEPGRRDDVRRYVIARVAHLEAQGCAD